MSPRKPTYSIHFIGVGGIGMSALARYFLWARETKGRWAVSGSDVVASELTAELAGEGVKISIGHRSRNIPTGTDLVIYNRAIRPENPELIAAHARNLVVLPYAKALGVLTAQYKTIAITGSHGKSTTTALTGLALAKGGLDPTVLVGTKLREFKNKNIRLGRSPYLVLEADDYAGAFWEYSPALSVVTNIDKEHLDFYKNFGGVKSAFLRFLQTTRPGGYFILNKDDATLFSMKAAITALAHGKKEKVLWYSTRSAAAKKIGKILKVPGEHNLSNAVAAYEVARVFGVPEKKTLAALAAYRGAWRRMEPRGIYKGARLFDDYAHHPTEIAATLKGFREAYPYKKILCVFQPHQSKRLNALFDDFVKAFSPADEVLVLPIYKVKGRDERHERYDARMLAAHILARFPQKEVRYLAKPAKLKAALSKFFSPFSKKVIVMMGAGDIVQLTDKLH